jgi:hypothetical protein
MIKPKEKRPKPTQEQIDREAQDVADQINAYLEAQKMPAMRAKVYCSDVTSRINSRGEKTSEELLFNPVCSKIDQDGMSEDNTYAKYTPSGSLKFTVTNPALWDRFRPDPQQTFYVDFTPADK